MHTGVPFVAQTESAVLGSPATAKSGSTRTRVFTRGDMADHLRKRGIGLPFVRPRWALANMAPGFPEAPIPERMGACLVTERTIPSYENTIPIRASDDGGSLRMALARDP